MAASGKTFSLLIFAHIILTFNPALAKCPKHEVLLHNFKPTYFLDKGETIKAWVMLIPEPWEDNRLIGSLSNTEHLTFSLASQESFSDTHGIGVISRNVTVSLKERKRRNEGHNHASEEGINVLFGVEAFSEDHSCATLKAGYYMTSDVFGQAGDFITSPEISQVFGELVGVWFVNQWILSGKKKVNFVELGPGRGTLASDILRVFGKFPELHSKLSLHLVEVSPALSEIQEKNLTDNHKNDQEKQCVVTDDRSTDREGGSELCYKKCVTQNGTPVSWYRAIQDISYTGNCFFIAHEFFDALPVHQFQHTYQMWKFQKLFLCCFKTVVYDLLKLGCPLSVQSSEPFKPIIDVYDGETFVKEVDVNYVLWEQRGRAGYKYSKTMKEVGCMREAQSWEKMINSMKGGSIESAWSKENYQTCFQESADGSISADNLHERYEILNSSGAASHIVWTDVGTFVFLLKVLDPEFSFCNLTVEFGVQVHGVRSAMQEIPTFVVLGSACLTIVVLMLSAFHTTALCSE